MDEAFGNSSLSSSLEVEAGLNEKPIPRTGHTAVYYDKFMYIFGGCSADDTRLNDTWKFDLKNKELHHL